MWCVEAGNVKWVEHYMYRTVIPNGNVTRYTSHLIHSTEQYTEVKETSSHVMYAYVCMYVCMYVYIYVCMYVCMWVYMYICMCVCMHIYVCMYVCIHIYIYIYICMYICMYVCVWVLSVLLCVLCTYLWIGYTEWPSAVPHHTNEEMEIRIWENTEEEPVQKKKWEKRIVTSE